MPKLGAEDYHAEELADDLVARGFPHLRVRRRADVLTIESGPKKDPVAHARLRRIAVHLWRLEMQEPDGTWVSTPYRLPINAQLELLVTQFAWVLAPRPTIPTRTSGRQY
jgi:hypothetical protein